MSLLNKTKGNTLYFKKKKLCIDGHFIKVKKNQHINRERKNQRKKKKPTCWR